MNLNNLSYSDSKIVNNATQSVTSTIDDLLSIISDLNDQIDALIDQGNEKDRIISSLEDQIESNSI